MRLALIGSALLAAVMAAGALAAPGDPPIATKAPPSGSTVSASDFGIKVEFGCPAYSKSVEVDEEEEKKEPGDADDYGVHFSTSSAIGADGLLTTAGFGDDGEGLVDVASDKVTCSAELQLPTTPIPADLYSGTVYWQAYRSCDSCGGEEYEAGPVNSFVVTPNVEDPELTLEDHVYAGYLTEVSFSTSSDLDGATYVLQRWDGKEWLQMDEAPASLGDAAYFVKFKHPGHTQLRVLIAAAGVTYATEPQKLAVREPGGRRSVGAADDGRYLVPKAERKTAPAHFEVVDDGQALTGLRARVESKCTAGGASAPTSATVAVKRARIAPDGTVVAELHTTSATPAVVTLVGNLHDRHFSGELSTTFLNCTGTRRLEADLGGVPQKQT